MTPSWDQLEQVAALAPEEVTTPRPSPNGQPRSGSFNLDDWLARVAPSKSWEFGEPRRSKDGGREIPFKSGCPFQPDYHDGNAAIHESPSGQLGFNCFCGDHPEKSWRDLRELAEGPRTDKRNEQQAGTQPKDDDNTPRIRSIADVPLLSSFADAKVQWLVEYLIAVATVVLLTGESGDGKTTLALAIAGAVAGEYPFANRSTVCRPVLVLDRENPLSIIRDRFHQLGIQDSETFRIWGGWCEEEAPDPASPIIVEWVQACEPKPLIVVDSLVAFNPAAENDASEMRRYMHRFRRLANMGATVLLLHHSGKAESAKDYRGSSDIKAAVDAAYNVAKIGDDAGVLDRVRLRAFKNRFLGKTDVVLRYVDGEFTSESGETFQTKTVTELLTELLKKNSRINSRDFLELAKKQKLGRNRAADFLVAGAKDGAIKIEFGEHRARLHTWVGRAGKDGLFDAV